MHNNYQEFACDLCGSSDAVEVPHARQYTNNQPIHICTQCGFVYVKMRRTAQQIADDWSDKIFGSGYTAAIPAIKARLTFVAEFIDTNLELRNKKVCDIGAGEGFFLDMIRQDKYGASVFGVEPSSKNCDTLSRMGIDHYLGTIEEYHEKTVSENQKVDIVTIMWTLENCQSCSEMLAAAHAILKDDGHVVVVTGSRLLVPFKKPLHYYFSKNPADTHPFRFSANTLRGTLAMSGFDLTDVNRYIDHDILAMIARKVDITQTINWERDNYLEVYNFFERWHVETAMYYNNS